MKRRITALLLILFVCASGQAFAWTGQVVSVTDGDTIKVLQDGRETKIRLYGVDCPEKNGQAFGMKAKDFTASLVAGKLVDVEPVDQDRYGRTVGIVTVAGLNLNGELVKNGFAWVYRQYCRRGECSVWLQNESRARESRIGLWLDPVPMPPWDWRRENK